MKVDVKGTIVSNDDKWIYDWFEMDSTAPADVLGKLDEANGQDVDIYINSGGGDVFAGNEIYAAIRAYSGKARIHVVGLAASAASVIMCAAPCDISPTAMVMIHNVSSYAGGNYMDFEHEAEVLRTASRAICSAYVEKTGKPEAEMQALMDQEKWFTAAEAVDIGLCDEITGEGLKLVAAMAPMIPEAVIAKIKGIKAEKDSRQAALAAASDRLSEMEAKA